VTRALPRMRLLAACAALIVLVVAVDSAMHISLAEMPFGGPRPAAELQVGGFVGWWIWLFIHIAFLTGYRNRVGAVLTWWLAFTRDLRRERTFTTQQIETLGDVYTLPLGPEVPAAAPQAVAADGPSRPPGSHGDAPGGEPRATGG